MLLKKNKFKPIFKQYLKLRENVQNRNKLLKFKKKKWQIFLTYYKKKLKRYKKFKSMDHSKYFLTKYGNQRISYKKRFKSTLNASKKLRIFYGNLSKKYLKKKIKTTLNKKKLMISMENAFLCSFERRLDAVLYRAKFVSTIQSAQQLILHGKVCVNQIQIKSKAYNLKNGDIINLNLSCFNLYENHIINTNKWPIPAKHLLINYKTLQILVIENIESTNAANDFLFDLQLQKIFVNYFKQ